VRLVDQDHPDQVIALPDDRVVQGHAVGSLHSDGLRIVALYQDGLGASKAGAQSLIFAGARPGDQLIDRDDREAGPVCPVPDDRLGADYGLWDIAVSESGADRGDGRLVAR